MSHPPQWARAIAYSVMDRMDVLTVDELAATLDHVLRTGVEVGALFAEVAETDAAKARTALPSPEDKEMHRRRSLVAKAIKDDVRSILRPTTDLAAEAIEAFKAAGRACPSFLIEASEGEMRDKEPDEPARPPVGVAIETHHGDHLVSIEAPLIGIHAAADLDGVTVVINGARARRVLVDNVSEKYPERAEQVGMRRLARRRVVVELVADSVTVVPRDE